MGRQSLSDEGDELILPTRRVAAPNAFADCRVAKHLPITGDDVFLFGASITPTHDRVSRQTRCCFNAIAKCDIAPPRPCIASQHKCFNVTSSKGFGVVGRRCGIRRRVRLQIRPHSKRWAIFFHDKISYAVGGCGVADGWLRATSRRM
jgi:hypothetical protein